MGAFTSQMASFGSRTRSPAESGASPGTSSAGSTAAAGADPEPTAAQQAQVRDAVALADLCSTRIADLLGVLARAWTRLRSGSS